MNAKQFQDELFEAMKKSLDEGTNTMLIIGEKFGYIAKNYDTCEPELQKMYDIHVLTCKKILEDKVAKMDDSIERRELNRSIRKLNGEHHNFLEIYNSIAIDRENKDSIIIKSKDFIHHDMQIILDLMSDVVSCGKTVTYNESLKLSLYYYIIEELTVVIYLLEHHFVNQSYTHLRSVFETLDLIELFEKDESLIELWKDNSSDEEIQKKKRNTFMPNKVREVIGKKDSIYEEIYWTLCEIGTHTTFKNIQTRTCLTLTSKENENNRFSIKLGGIPFKEDIFLCNSMLLQTISFVILSITNSYADYFLKEEIEKILDKMVEDTKKLYLEIMTDDLKKVSFDTNKLVDFLANYSVDKSE